MVTNKNLKLLAIALLLMNAGIASAAPTTTFVMQPPNGYHIPKVIGISGDAVPMTGFDHFEWFGFTHHRTWFKPSISTLPNDSSVNSDSTFAAATEAIRQDPLRQATSSDYYIDWNRFYSEFDNNKVSDDIQRLTALGIKSMIINTVFVSSTPITGQWTNIFKYWKSWYAMVYFMASNYNTTMYEFRNEPHAAADYDTWESHWLVAADAMRKAMNDVNEDYGKSLPIYICGPTEPGPYWDYSFPDPYVDVHGWGSVSWAKVKYDIYGNYNVNNPWNYGMYDYHRYNNDGAENEAEIAELRDDIATAHNDPHPTIPLLITEYNTATGSRFTELQKDTEDLFYGISTAQILQATAGLGPDGLGDEGGFFEFKTGSHVSTGPYEGIVNRVCYTSPYPPYNYGGITRGGACFQMYSAHFRNGKAVIPFTGGDNKHRAIAAVDTEKNLYYFYASNVTGTQKTVVIDFSALDVSAGAPVTIQRVDAYNTGQITEKLNLDGSKKTPSFSVPDKTAYLVIVRKGSSVLTETVIEPTDDTMQNVADTVIHGSETTMNVSLHHNVPAERRAAFVRYTVNNIDDTTNRVMLRLSGRNVGVDQTAREILHVYAVSGVNWDENTSMAWTTAPGVGLYYITSTTMATANGLGDMVDIEDNYAGVTNGAGTGLGIYGQFVGAVSFYSNAYKTNYLDVTDYLKSVAIGSTADVTFVIAGIVRYNVNQFDNPYYYTLGDYHYDGRIVEIASKENANPDLRPIVVVATLAIDTAPPTPNPATFATAPYATGAFSIAMVATTGSDVTGPVQYYFDETSGNPGGTDSGWQTSASYTDSGLNASTQYTYTVQMRDSVTPTPNTGTASSPASATTWADDTNPPTPNPATFATAPYATGAFSIAMVATTGSDVTGPVQYYFDETSGNPGGTDSGWQTSASYTDSGLNASTQYTYTVQMRDAVTPTPNVGTASAPASATTQAAPAPTFVAAGAVKSGTKTITPELPSGIATGDILLLFLETSNQAISITNQNGGTWTAVTNSPQYCGTAAGATGARLTAFWSRYNGTQGAPTASDSGDHQLGRIIAIRGAVASGNPWDVTAGGVEATDDTSGSIPGATTTVANTLVVTAIATSLPDADSTAKFSAWTNANLTSLTERTDNSVDDGNGGGLGIATGVKATAGAYGNTAVTLVDAAYKGMISIAIKP